MASTIKVTNIDTPDNTGNITVDRPLSGSGASLTSLPAANLTGTIAAISGANLTNLPAANLTGTIAAISGANLTALNATQLTSGTIPAARLGSKKILQAVAGSSGASGSMSSTTSWTDTGHSASITPSATSSTIWVMVTTGGIYQATANQGFSYYTTLYRNGSNIGSNTTGLTATYCFGMPNYTNIFTRAMSMSKIDSPSSTSAVEYKIYQRTAQSGCSFVFNDSGTTTITLFEIGA